MARSCSMHRKALAACAAAIVCALRLDCWTFSLGPRTASSAVVAVGGHRKSTLQDANGPSTSATWCGATGLTMAFAAATTAAAVTSTSRARACGTALRYTTQSILPALTWLKTGLTSRDLGPGDFQVTCLAGCDVCVGRTSDGKLFAVGDKAPPTGISFSAGSEVQGNKIIERQYGNAFDVFSGMPEGDWCPFPPIIGSAVGAIMGGPQAIAVFEVRESFLVGSIEVLVDVNAKRAYETAYWKGVLDAQGKDDGSFY